MDFKIIKREERVRDYILPCKIKKVSGNIANSGALLKQKKLQIALSEPDSMTIKGAGYIILDFGREFCGGVRILTHTAQGNTKIRLRFGESLTETCADCVPLQNATATNDHAMRDFEFNLTMYSDMQLGQTGFRFIRLDFYEGCNIIIKSIVGVYEHRDLKRLGSFECNDEIINKIFDTAAYTVELNMQSMLWDGIKRDRLVWIGDMHPETLSIISLFGKHECVTEALTFIREITPLPGFMNTMPAYSLWWLAILSDYFMQNADYKLLESEKDYIISLVNFIDGLLDKGGNLNFPDFFLDWPTAGLPERKAGVYALLAFAMEKTKALYKALKLDAEILDGMIKRIDKNLSACNLKQVLSFKYLAGHSSSKDVLDKLLKGGAEGLSTFMSYYILSSMALCGKKTEALEIMKEYYNGMLSRGATTFWEDFDIKWLEGSGSIDEFPKKGEKDLHGDYGAYCYKGFRHSLCHGWSSGPVPFIMHHILGIRVLEEGCKKVEVKPALCGLKWFKGSYPTPYGLITVEHNGKNVVVKAPKEVEIVK